MRCQRNSMAAAWAVWLFIFPSLALGADEVSPGDVIEKKNWEKAEGLLPGPVLEWVKKGDFVLTVGALNYAPADFFTPEAMNGLKTNNGKYGLDGKDQIIETASGKVAKFVDGIPFPSVDPGDPKAAIKAIYNKEYHSFSLGNIYYPFQMIWVGRSSGFEREVGAVYINAPLDGYAKAKETPNPENIQRYCLVLAKQPFDIAGTSVLLWRYHGEKQDINFSYVPAIRRVRRMSPSNRSDGFVGSDICVDDAWGYDGKVPAFEWRFAGKQEGLVPYKSPDPEAIVQNEKGEWVTTAAMTPSTYGYQTEGWKGAPWAPVSFIWVKRNLWVIKAISKDPYYNYGSIDIWYDPEIMHPKYSVIYDRAGAYWKVYLIGHGGFQSPDKQMKFTAVTIQEMIDDRSQHASVVENMSQRNIWVHFAEMDLNDFSIAGFQKFCK
ncbi:MAG: DUF1329 domain-containing protein [bacterium]